MSKLKTFKREDVLDQAISLFWKKGYVETSINDLDDATGLKKSSLYSEFENKEDIFICSLNHYSKTCIGAGFLDRTPLGWGNVERLLSARMMAPVSDCGCFIIFSMREYTSLSAKSQKVLEGHLTRIKGNFFKNVAAEKTNAAPEMVTEVLMTFFVGMALNQNLRIAGAKDTAPVADVIALLKQL